MYLDWRQVLLTLEVKNLAKIVSPFPQVMAKMKPPQI